MQIRKFLVLIPILVSILACQSAAKPSATQQANKTPTSSTPTAIPLSARGLVYGTQNEGTGERSIWQVGQDGTPRILISDYSYAQFSPDGKQAVYYDNIFQTGSGCTWLADFSKQQVSQLDCTIAQSAGGISMPAAVLGWVPNDPNTIVALLNRTGSEMGGSLGYVGTISNGKKNLIDETRPTQNAATSPDGQTIAYSSYDPKSLALKGWLYSKPTGVVEFDPKAYGVIGYSQIDNPDWSPDGKSIAWGLMKDDLFSAVVVFDLQSRTSKIIYTYQQTVAMDTGSTPPSPKWSGDGQWLFLRINARGADGSYDSEQSGDWFFRVNGGEKHKVDGDFLNLSPDGAWITYINRSQDVNALELRVAKIDGSDMHVLGKSYGYDSALWSRDGHSLAFVDSDGVVQLTEAGKWELHSTNITGPNIALLDWVAPLQVSSEMLASIPALPAPTNAPDFSCPNAPSPRVQVGDSARITFTDGTTTRLRSVPEAGDNIIDNLPEGTEFKIIEGPVCYPRPGRSDAYVYWKVNVPSRNVTGWLAEGDANGYYIEPLK